MNVSIFRVETTISLLTLENVDTLTNTNKYTQGKTSL